MSIMSRYFVKTVRPVSEPLQSFSKDGTETATWTQQDPQTHATSQETLQKRQEDHNIDASDGQVDEWEFHTYNADVIHLSFDERIRKLKISLQKHKQEIDSKHLSDDGEFLHRGMEAILQDILQLWSNEDTKLCNVHELRVLTQEALVMYKKRQELFWYS